ncbi:MAG: hypothetical protein U5K37_13395 [Natrialbaceae archaeon]|nr:hypothetical protein [Natrialbaceae archaeon]
MATDTMSGRREHIRSIGVTGLAALLGVGAALVSSAITGDLAPAEAAADQRAVIVLLAAILIQFPILTVTGIYDRDEFGPKHYLFITFMTFSLWFVTWGILLTAEHTA